MARQTTYRDSGVNIELGDDASQVLYEAAKLTWKNRKGKLGEVVELFEDFSGLRAIHIGGLPEDAYMNMGFDGVGTKMELGERIAKHDTVAYDLFAMVCDDAVVRGAEPVLVGSVLDVRTLREEDQSYISLVKQIGIGYIKAAEAANVAVVNGEIAELGARVQGYSAPASFLERLRYSFRYLTQGELPPTHGFHYNWAAGVSWFATKDRILTGHEIREGDYLIGLKEEGFRSNGLSLVRKILRTKHSRNWHEEEFNGENLAELALHPSRIYTRAIVDMFGSFDSEPKAEVHGVVHITGGGIPGKLGRILKPSRFGAYIDDPFVPCDLMLYCQEKGEVADEEAYKTWNMGQGMIVITPSPERVIEIAKGYGIESKVMGVVKRSPGIDINSRGVEKRTLHY